MTSSPDTPSADANVGDDARPIELLIRDLNLELEHLSDANYRAMAREVMRENENVVEAIKGGKDGKVKFLVGAMMRRGGGKVVARRAEGALRGELGVEGF